MRRETHPATRSLPPVPATMSSLSCHDMSGPARQGVAAFGDGVLTYAVEGTSRVSANFSGVLGSLARKLNETHAQ